MTDPTMPAAATLADLLAEVRATRATLERVEAQLCLRESEVARRDDLLTLKQAAFEFGKSIDTVRRWADDERIGIKVGGRWMISRAALERAKFSKCLVLPR